MYHNRLATCAPVRARRRRDCFLTLAVRAGPPARRGQRRPEGSPSPASEGRGPPMPERPRADGAGGAPLPA